MELVAQALPVPARRPLLPEVLGEERRSRRHGLVLAGDPVRIVVIPLQGYAPEPPAQTGLLVDVYG